VHRHFFEAHSTYLKELFSTVPLHNTDPVPLVGVKQSDFEKLLSYFYPAYASYLLFAYL